jgi:hypothetical protein
MSEDLREKQPQNVNNTEILRAIKRLEESQHALDSDITGVNNRMNDVERDQRVINDAVRRMQMDFLTVTEWLNKLTADRNQQNSST